jgi:hypothetical protein
MQFYLRVRKDSKGESAGRMRTEGSAPGFLGIFQRADRFMQDLNMTASPKGPYDLNIIRTARVETELD